MKSLKIILQLFLFLFLSCSFDVIPVALQNKLDTPAGISVIAVSDTRIDISWNNFDQDVEGFILERATVVNGSGTNWTIINDNNTTSYSDTGLYPDTEYFYRVLAYNNNIQSNYSNIKSAKTKSANATTPDTPTELKIIKTTS